MKLYKRIAVAASLFLLPVSVFAAAGYGAAGCGLGSMVFGSKPGAEQVVAATTNGTFGSQTFGITFGTSTAFDISGILPHDPEAGALGVLGSILRALVGYTSTPEWTTFAAWLVYIVVVLYLYTRPIRPSGAPAAAPEPTAAGA